MTQCALLILNLKVEHFYSKADKLTLITPGYPYWPTVLLLKFHRIANASSYAFLRMLSYVY